MNSSFIQWKFANINRDQYLPGSSLLLLSPHKPTVSGLIPHGQHKICSTRFQSFVPKTIQQSSSGIEMKRRKKEDWQFTTKREVALLPRWGLYPTPNPVSLYVSYIVVRPCILNAWLCTHTTRILADSARKKIKLDKEEKRRQQSIKELIMTEQAYIDDMSVVHDVSTVQLVTYFAYHLYM